MQPHDIEEKGMPIFLPEDLYANIHLFDNHIMGRVKHIYDDCVVLTSFSDEKISFDLANVDIFSASAIHFKGLPMQIHTDYESPGAHAVAAQGEREITLRFIEIDDSQRVQMRMMVQYKPSGF